MKNFFILLTVIFFSTCVLAQEVDNTIRQGNDLYKKEQYQQADSTYSAALEKAPTNNAARFNKANAVYKQGKSEEAVRLLNDIAFKSEDNESKARAYYNKGAILSAQKKLEESIEAYKDALRRDPTDKDARENLQKALTELKKKNPPPPPKENKKQQQQKQKQQQQPKMNQKEAEQRLKLLEQKEKEVQQRLQKEKAKSGGGGQKDW